MLEWIIYYVIAAFISSVIFVVVNVYRAEYNNEDIDEIKSISISLIVGIVWPVSWFAVAIGVTSLVVMYLIEYGIDKWENRKKK